MTLFFGGHVAKQQHKQKDRYTDDKHANLATEVRIYGDKNIANQIATMTSQIQNGRRFIA